MPPQAKTVLSGISAVGHITDPYDTAVKVPWGKTEQDGVTLDITPEKFQVLSGQGVLPTHEGIPSVGMGITIRLQYSDLLTWARAMGLEDSAVTGDLQDVTPTDEVLEPLVTAIGKTERYMYIDTPGPAGLRTIELKRVSLVLEGSVSFASTSHQSITVGGTVLEPTEAGHENTPIKFTDAA